MGLLQEGLISTSRALRANLPRVEQRQHRGNHTHRHRGESWRRLSLVLLLTAFYMFAAVGGLAVNLICAWILHARHEVDLNLRGAWMHVMGDALGSVAAILAGVCMALFGWYEADAVFSVVIGLLIIWGSMRLIRESTNVLLEGTPAHINLAAVEDAILATDGVADVHDLHVWTITSGREALSAHVIHADSISQPDLLRELRTK